MQATEPTPPCRLSCRRAWRRLRAAARLAWVEGVREVVWMVDMTTSRSPARWQEVAAVVSCRLDGQAGRTAAG